MAHLSVSNFYKEREEWKLFFPFPPFIQKITALIEEIYIPSTHGPIHLDIYRQNGPAPVVVYCHGLSSSGRMMANLVLPLYQKGYHVVCPDLPGFGLSVQKHKMGSVRVEALVESLCQVTQWAAQEFKSPVFLTGISLGGTLSYYAAAQGAPLSALACLNLLDLSNLETLNVSRWGWLLRKIRPLLKALSKIAPEATLPLKGFVNPKKLCEQIEIVKQFQTNPLVVKSYTLSAAISLLTTPPAIPFENFDLVPILVLHGDQDRLIPEKITRDNFEKIRGKKKYVFLKDCEHIPLKSSAQNQYVQNLDEWFRLTLAPLTRA